MQLIQHLMVVLHLGVEEGIQFRLNLMEKPPQSRSKHSNKVCDDLIKCNRATWCKSLTEPDLGLMEDKILYFSGHLSCSLEANDPNAYM